MEESKVLDLDITKEIEHRDICHYWECRIGELLHHLFFVAMGNRELNLR